jgi:hypothetical protein
MTEIRELISDAAEEVNDRFRDKLADFLTYILKDLKKENYNGIDEQFDLDYDGTLSEIVDNVVCGVSSGNWIDYYDIDIYKEKDIGLRVFDNVREDIINESNSDIDLDIGYLYDNDELENKLLSIGLDSAFVEEFVEHYTNYKRFEVLR